MKISDNAAMLELGGANGAVYPTLTWDGGHLVLIDAGFPGQGELLTQAIADAGFDAKDLTHIILTHQDIDHIGCVPDLLRLAPAARVLAHETEAPYIDGRETPIKLAAMLEHYDSLPADRKAWCDQLKAGFAGRRIPVDQTLTDGEVLDFCGGIEALHTPGHTPGHICLFLRESGVLVGGDAVNIQDGEIAGPNPGYTYDLETGLKSAERMKALPMKGLISYHCGYLSKS